MNKIFFEFDAPKKDQVFGAVLKSFDGGARLRKQIKVFDDVEEQRKLNWNENAESNKLKIVLEAKFFSPFFQSRFIRTFHDPDTAQDSFKSHKMTRTNECKA